MSYEPDEHDELVGEALAAGGPVFVEALHWAATEAAEEICPWDGLGDEPHEYRSAWLTAARRMIVDRRVGELRTGCGDASSRHRRSCRDGRYAAPQTKRSRSD